MEPSVKKMAAVVHPKQLKAFMARCRAHRVYGQGVIRKLVMLYAEGRIGPAEMDAPEKPYKAWVILKADERTFRRLQSRATADGLPMAAVVRGLLNLFASGRLPEAFHDLVVRSAPFEPGGRGGRGWKGRAPLHIRRERRRASIERSRARARARAS